mmetsp:Transcript_56231/g.182501  ORF Transcript_56231/g.182501 Transcript_56231/m.182501 type:complete len:297 (+) Transcript_56231:2244-3134(+)
MHLLLRLLPPRRHRVRRGGCGLRGPAPLLHDILGLHALIDGPLEAPPTLEAARRPSEAAPASALALALRADGLVVQQRLPRHGADERGGIRRGAVLRRVGLADVPRRPRLDGARWRHVGAEEVEPSLRRRLELHLAVGADDHGEAHVAPDLEGPAPGLTREVALALPRRAQACCWAELGALGKQQHIPVPAVHNHQDLLVVEALGVLRLPPEGPPVPRGVPDERVVPIRGPSGAKPRQRPARLVAAASTELRLQRRLVRAGQPLVGPGQLPREETTGIEAVVDDAYSEQWQTPVLR